MSSIPLPARLNPEVEEFLNTEKETLFRTTEIFGSPTHVVLPQILGQNVSRFRAILQQYDLEQSEIYFASKVNKGESFLEQAANSGIGIDVSSIQELRAALGHGVIGSKISVSGPSKQDRLLALAVSHGCNISIDSEPELDSLFAVVEKFGKRQVQTSIRLAGMSDSYTRFGVMPDDIARLLAKMQAANMNLKGFHFHLSGYSYEERVIGLQKAIHEIEKARNLGHECNTINIGGGFAVRYVDPKAWQNFLSSKTASTFADSRDRNSFYPYGSEMDSEEQLNAILGAQTDVHQQIADLLKVKDIRLAIEPGRSLVDQAGFTCVQVKGIKKISEGTYIVEVDANINHLSEQWFNSDYCVDPIHLSKNTNVQRDRIEAAIGGNTCLEIDMLTWRKIGFTTTPQRGDLLVYPNTAGYQMDSNESSFHQLPIPEKIAAFKKDGTWKWKKDSEYSFLDAK